MILARFDAIVFIGDDTLLHIYAALNMLLRENIAMGALKQWDMTDAERASCRCDDQFTKPECFKHAIMDSAALSKNDAKSTHKSPYVCDRKIFSYEPCPP